MYKKKRGAALLECTIYIFLCVILSAILVRIILNIDYLYLKSINENINESDINDFFINVERFLNEDEVQKVEVINNTLIIYKGNSEKNFQKEEIYKEGNKVMVKYYDIRNFEDYNTRNTLGKDIENFRLKIKGKMIYLFIKKGGKTYIKCL